MTVKMRLVLREFMGERILVPSGEAVSAVNGLFMLSETAAYIWKILPEAKDEAEVLRHVLSEFEVAEERAREDVHAFLARLREYGLIDG